MYSAAFGSFSRTQEIDTRYNGPGYSGAANRVAGAPDGFRRRRFTTVVTPRNLL